MNKFLALALSWSILGVTACHKFEPLDPLHNAGQAKESTVSGEHLHVSGVGATSGLKMDTTQTYWALCRPSGGGSTRYVIYLLADQFRVVAHVYPSPECAGDVYESYITGIFKIEGDGTRIRRTAIYPGARAEDLFSVSQKAVSLASIAAEHSNTELALVLGDLRVIKDAAATPESVPGELELRFARLPSRPPEIISGMPLPGMGEVPQFTFTNPTLASSALTTGMNAVVDPAKCINEYFFARPRDISSKFEPATQKAISPAPIHSDLEKDGYKIAGISLFRLEDLQFNPYVAFFLIYTNYDSKKPNRRGVILCPLKGRAPGVAVDTPAS